MSPQNITLQFADPIVEKILKKLNFLVSYYLLKYQCLDFFTWTLEKSWTNIYCSVPQPGLKESSLAKDTLEACSQRPL